MGAPHEAYMSNSLEVIKIIMTTLTYGNSLVHPHDNLHNNVTKKTFKIDEIKGIFLKFKQTIHRNTK